jgi:hypothetical protein
MQDGVSISEWMYGLVTSLTEIVLHARGITNSVRICDHYHQHT